MSSWQDHIMLSWCLWQSLAIHIIFVYQIHRSSLGFLTLLDCCWQTADWKDYCQLILSAAVAHTGQWWHNVTICSSVTGDTLHHWHCHIPHYPATLTWSPHHHLIIYLLHSSSQSVLTTVHNRTTVHTTYTTVYSDRKSRFHTLSVISNETKLWYQTKEQSPTWGDLIKPTTFELKYLFFTNFLRTII